jgi:hypothetical protein
VLCDNCRISLVGYAYHAEFVIFYSRNPPTREIQCFPLFSCLRKLLKRQTRAFGNTTNTGAEEFQMQILTNTSSRGYLFASACSWPHCTGWRLRTGDRRIVQICKSTRLYCVMKMAFGKLFYTFYRPSSLSLSLSIYNKNELTLYDFLYAYISCIYIFIF